MPLTEPPRTRLRLDVSYDGTGFRGWASQPALRTVQGVLEAALATVLRTDGAGVTCAGRTDAGVHARGQVVHVDVDEERLAAAAGRSSDPPVDVLVRRLNGVLDPDVRVTGGAVAPDGFDARFSPLWRRYVYRVADRPAAVDPLLRHHVLVWPRPLDDTAMNTAAAAVLGERDFAAYCRKREGATTVRTLLELRWDRSPQGVAEATVRADAFCHNMVRALVGAMLAVGEGRRTTEWPSEVLTAGVRDAGVLVVPAHGLTLEEVAYPADDEVAGRALATRRTRTVPADG